MQEQDTSIRQRVSSPLPLVRLDAVHDGVRDLLDHLAHVQAERDRALAEAQTYRVMLSVVQGLLHEEQAAHGRLRRTLLTTRRDQAQRRQVAA
jgi:hypothetical protein